jgi:hypothetical protein
LLHKHTLFPSQKSHFLVIYFEDHASYNYRNITSCLHTRNILFNYCNMFTRNILLQFCHSTIKAVT